MAAEAEAAREARAKIIKADGEKKATKYLREAANVLEGSQAALQLRYLQTLSTIGNEKNTTIIFPVPIDIISGFLPRNAGQASKKPSPPKSPIKAGLKRRSPKELDRTVSIDELYAGHEEFYQTNLHGPDPSE